MIHNRALMLRDNESTILHPLSAFDILTLNHALSSINICYAINKEKQYRIYQLFPQCSSIWIIPLQFHFTRNNPVLSIAIFKTAGKYHSYSSNTTMRLRSFFPNFLQIKRKLSFVTVYLTNAFWKLGRKLVFWGNI